MDDIIKGALDRFNEIVNSLECECDSYNGFTCSIHSDRVLASQALEEFDKIKKDSDNRNRK